jgi:hypothetical protein
VANVIATTNARERVAMNRGRAGYAVGVCVVCVMLLACGHHATRAERDRAVAEARQVYATVASGGQDLSSGPCIADQLTTAPDWSVDIAHEPRAKIDNQAANQCHAYRSGKTHHFVELTPEGKLIRAK